MKKTAFILSAALMISGSVFAGESKTYEVTLTNLTKGQIFTPVLAATHKSSIAFFELGAPASDELEMLAEDGATDPLNDLLMSVPSLVQDTTGTDPIMPGATGVAQAGRGLGAFSTCTRHIRQLAATESVRW